VINGYIEKLHTAYPLRQIDPKNVEIHITGADRDDSTFYLKYFPEFKLDLVDEDREVSKFLTATAVRNIYFGRTFNDKELSPNDSELLLKSFLPHATIDFLRGFEETEDYENIREEHVFNVNYRKPFQVRPPRLPGTFGPLDPGDLGLPYEHIFHTVDSVVIQTGYVLLIKRRSRPGKGLWAFPGGHLNMRERLFTGAIRELREETKLKVPEPVLRGSLKFHDDFDYQDRSLRGRTITTAYLFNLPEFVVDGRISLPEIKAADDAVKAMWVSLDVALNSPELFFEDHHDILEVMMGKL
jgi:bifunctional NMN adenylyltransferase/nudix hydrolase